MHSLYQMAYNNSAINITLCYKNSRINNYQQEYCLGVYLEENWKKYFEIDAYLHIYNDFNAHSELTL